MEDIKTTLCKTDREEIKKCLDELAQLDALYQDDRFRETLLHRHPAFKHLEAIANQEVHPSGDQSLLSNQSIYSWERLVSMKYEAYNALGRKEQFEPVLNALNAEIERRLLALLPK